MNIYFFTVYKQCSQPPKGKFSTWKTDYAFGIGKFWSGMLVKYTCVDKYSFTYDQAEVLTCKKDGTWSQDYAPICEPSKLSFLFF